METKKMRARVRGAYQFDVLLFPLGGHWVAYDRDAVLIAAILDLPVCYRDAAPYAGIPTGKLRDSVATLRRFGYTVKIICE